eukprot:scaffold68994_cov28-Tisochrysis_lutea.AAC.4
MAAAAPGVARFPLGANCCTTRLAFCRVVKNGLEIGALCGVIRKVVRIVQLLVDAVARLPVCSCCRARRVIQARGQPHEIGVVAKLSARAFRNLDRILVA